MRAAAPSVCAVVITYNRPGMLSRCLRALDGQTRRPDGILVVNNASAAATDRVLAAWRPTCEVVRLPDNEGSAPGFQVGLRAAVDAGYDWAWIMDDDPVPERCALARLASLAGRVPAGEPAAFSSVQFDPALDKYNAGFLWRGLPRAVPRTWIDRGRPYPVDLAPFCGFLVNRALVDEVGYPRPDFFARFEDYEYCLRIRAQGLAIYVDPRSRMVHPLGERNAAGHVVTRDQAWKAYYDMRNRVYTTARLRRQPAEVLQELRFGVMQSAREVVLDARRGLPNALARIHGTVDGLTGRMGKTLDPARGGRPARRILLDPPEPRAHGFGTR